VYPRLDSAVSTIPGVPPIDRAIGFDADYGVLAFVDAKGQPRRLDLRATESRLASKEKLTGLISVNGSDIYGLTPAGSVSRITPTGDWSFQPPSPARWIFPQPDGSVVLAGAAGGTTSLWLIRPTDDQIIESATLPAASGGVRTQVGDRLYFTVDTGLIGVRTRDLTPVKGVRIDDPVVSVAPTPSGDRLYIAVNGSDKLSVADRYSEGVTEAVALPGPAGELRMDPLGQYVLVNPAGGGDSAWVVSVGTNRVSGTIRSQWRADLPAFSPGGTIATARGADVIFVDAGSLRDALTVSGGSRDYWYFTSWNGFRPRAAGLDTPVTFGGGDSSSGPDTSAPTTPGDTVFSPPLRDAAGPTMVELPPIQPPRARGYMVSFAAVLSEQKANEAATGIAVNGVRPRVVATKSGSTTIYRVVLGPYASREEAERVGRDSRRQYWVYEEAQ